MPELTADMWILFSVFLIGYAVIIFEQFLGLDKAAVALIMAISCWSLFFIQTPTELDHDLKLLYEQFSGVSQIVFFLLSALAIVEVINGHNAFSLLIYLLQVATLRRLLWVTSLITFFLSSVLDNLTTTIVMLSLLRQLLPAGKERLIIGGAIVIAANSGGAWTPIGDVTTTMLWIGGQISSYGVIQTLFLPSLVCLVVSTQLLAWLLPKQALQPMAQPTGSVEPHGRTILFLGMGALLFVPCVKMLTGLPPLMGILFGLALLWLVTDFLHRRELRHHLRMQTIFTKIDISCVFFFTGILLCVAALESSGLLRLLAEWLDHVVGREDLIALLLGFLSAVIDNVPLVASTMAMYPVAIYPMDHGLWPLLAYCAGTGGSLLIIGSAAGVVFMAIEQVSFGWYLRYISLAALVGYLAGLAVLLLTVTN